MPITESLADEVLPPGNSEAHTKIQTRCVRLLPPYRGAPPTTLSTLIACHDAEPVWTNWFDRSGAMMLTRARQRLF